MAVAIEEAVVGYRGWLVTEAVDGARPLIEAYADCGDAARVRLLEGVGRAMSALHEVGVYHVDLTGHNILVGPGNDVTIVDFDRAFLAAPRHRRYAEAGVRRFWRSMDKLGSSRRLPVANDARRWLQAGYES